MAIARGWRLQYQRTVWTGNFRRSRRRQRADYNRCAAWRGGRRLPGLYRVTLADGVWFDVKR